jgi:hypothetical protein
MRYLNLITAAFFFFQFVFTSIAQQRENRVNLKFDVKSEKINEATGWMKNSQTGEWIDNKNVIYSSKCPTYWVSQLHQNFIWIQNSFFWLLKGKSIL